MLHGNKSSCKVQYDKKRGGFILLWVNLDEVAVDLVAVEVRVVAVAVRVVHAQSLFAHVRQYARLMRHDAWLVQRRLR